MLAVVKYVQYVTFRIKIIYVYNIHMLVGRFLLDKMEAMGYNRKEVEESLADNKYNDIMATYLLLSRKVSEVCNRAIFIDFLLVVNVKNKLVK